MYFDDIAIVALIPGIVEVAKRLGMPVRFSGLAAIFTAFALVALGDIEGGSSVMAQPARWVTLGVVYGLAASGLYSQVRRVPRNRPTPRKGGSR